MPHLVHLNGPPGIGKSTLARKYVDDHPLAFCLDIDSFRALIGQWESHPRESGRLARRMAFAMAREHVMAGHDVIVPQFVARPAFVRELAELAREVGAQFVEVVLMDEPASAEARFESRANDPVWANHHRDATRMLNASGGYRAMYDALVAVLEELPDAVVVATNPGDVEGAYRALMDTLGRRD